MTSAAVACSHDANPSSLTAPVQQPKTFKQDNPSLEQAQEQQRALAQLRSMLTVQEKSGSSLHAIHDELMPAAAPTGCLGGSQRSFSHELQHERQSADSHTVMVKELLSVAQAQRQAQAEREKELRQLVDTLSEGLRAERRAREAVSMELAGIRSRLDASAGAKSGTVCVSEEFGNSPLKEPPSDLQKGPTAGDEARAGAWLCRELPAEEGRSSVSEVLRKELDAQQREHAAGLKEIAELFLAELAGVRASSDEQCRLLLEEIQGERETRNRQLSEIQGAVMSSS